MIVGGVIVIIIIIFLIFLFLKIKKNKNNNECVPETNVNYIYNEEQEYQKDLELTKRNFYIALGEYEKLIANYNYEIIRQKDYERIYCVEGKFITSIILNL